MNKRCFYSIIIACMVMLYSCQNLSSTHIKLMVQLENAPFDTLFIYYYSDSSRITFKGKEIRKHLWKFSLPDKILENSEFLRLTNLFYNQQNNCSYMVRLYGETNENKNYLDGFVLERNIINHNIYAKYNNKEQLKDHVFVDFNTKSELEIITNNVIAFNFKVINKNDDIYIMTQQPFFSEFRDLYNRDKTYNDFLIEYKTLSKDYPDSKYLIYSLSENLLRYRNKDDIREIFDNLSNNYKNTKWGFHIEQFLNSSFENTILPVLNKNSSDYIVTDSSKLNLVVFTASWCIPCREEIPLLKKIYNDLKERLIITLITLDDEKSIESFKKLIQKESIPWRVLISSTNDSIIKKKYFIDKGIPHGILVYPDRKMDIIDVRDREQREKLYSACKE